MTGPAPLVIWPRLNRDQQNSLRRIKELRTDADAASAKAATALARLHSEVYDALSTRDVPARVVAEELGLSVSRVYQIRDEVSAWRATHG